MTLNISGVPLSDQRDKSSGGKRLLDDLVVDVLSEGDALLELGLVVRLCTLCLDVLLNSVYLRFVHYELLLNFVELVVDLVLEDQVLLRVVAHRVVRGLLRETVLVLLHEPRYDSESLLFFLERGFQLVSLGELVLHLVLHLGNLLTVLFHFLVNAPFQVLNLL